MFRFAEIENIYWILILFVVILTYFYSFYRKKQALLKLADPALHAQLTDRFSLTKQWVKFIFVITALLMLIITLLRPQGDPVTKTIKKQGRDLVFVLDISKSMLAEDLKPNRLERAKQLISDVVDVLEGDRVALLVFAGSTAIKSPLTLDYYYFKNILSRISPDDVNKGGTNIGDAIRVVSQRLFYDQDNKFRDIILITDGEDHESFPLEAAEDAAQKGIRINTVGLGNPDGANIPIRQTENYSLLKYKSKVVETRLDETTLKKISEITKGVFIPVRTNLVDLADLYKDYIASSLKNVVESKKSKIWSELYQFFLGIAIIFLMVETVLGEIKFRFHRKGGF